MPRKLILLLLSSVLVLPNVYANAKETNKDNKTNIQPEENTSKPIDFEKAKKMSPQELKESLTKKDIDLHNKVAEKNKDEIQNSTANNSYRDVNKYISEKNIQPSKIFEDNRINTLPKYNYKSGKYIGVVIHETANPNSTITGEVNYMYNNYNNAFVHAYVSNNQIIQTAPSNYLSWGAGAMANPYFYQIELTRSHTFDNFARSVNNQAYLAAKMLKNNGLQPSLADNNQGTGTIISHNAISKYWGGTDHTDPVGYFNQWGYNMNEFYALVQKHYNSITKEKAKDTISSATYKVLSGDTLYSISKRSGVTLANIKKWNNLKDDSLSVGQILKLRQTKDEIIASKYNGSKYVTISRAKIKVWKNMSLNSEMSSNKFKIGNVFNARYQYNHPNGQKYLSLYNDKGQWMGYFNKRDVIDVVGKSFNKKVTINKKNGILWQDFYFKKKKGTTESLYNKQVDARLVYTLGNGRQYYSIYSDKGTWLGYLNKVDTK